VLESINPESVVSDVLSLSIIGLLRAFRADESDRLRTCGERTGDLTRGIGSGAGVGGTGLLMSKGAILGLRESGTTGMGVEGERGQTGTGADCCRRGGILCTYSGGGSSSGSIEKMSIESDDDCGGDRRTALCRGGGITSSGKSLLDVSAEGEKSCIKDISSDTHS
jgi:hypothetical protein